MKKISVITVLCCLTLQLLAAVTPTGKVNITLTSASDPDGKVLRIRQHSSFSDEFDNTWDAQAQQDGGIYVLSGGKHWTAWASNQFVNLPLGFGAIGDLSYTLTFSNFAGEDIRFKDLLTGEEKILTANTTYPVEYTFSITESERNTAINDRFVINRTGQEQQQNIVLLESENTDYYTSFKSGYDGKTVNATLNRQFGAGNWETLCLPFDVNKAMMTALKMYGRVFEFSHGDKNTETETYVLYFAKANTIQAGRGYVVNANRTMAAKTSFTFSNVTIDLSADRVTELNSTDAYDGLNGYNDGTGTIELVGTLRYGIVPGSQDNNRYMGLKDNKIYVPNTESGTAVRAYRGCFRSSVPFNAGRVRIIVEGEQVAELEAVDGELREARETGKYMDNGTLYIRSNGNVYDAQGKKVR